MSQSNHKKTLKEFQSDLLAWFVQWFSKNLTETKTKVILDTIEQEVQSQVNEEIKEFLEPVFTEEPPKDIGSPAALLGGALRLSAKWQKNEKSPD